jgi:hypothetical protein
VLPPSHATAAGEAERPALPLIERSMPWMECQTRAGLATDRDFLLVHTTTKVIVRGQQEAHVTGEMLQSRMLRASTESHVEGEPRGEH